MANNTKNEDQNPQKKEKYPECPQERNENCFLLTFPQNGEKIKIEQFEQPKIQCFGVGLIRCYSK